MKVSSYPFSRNTTDVPTRQSLTSDLHSSLKVLRAPPTLPPSHHRRWRWRGKEIPPTLCCFKQQVADPTDAVVMAKKAASDDRQGRRVKPQRAGRLPNARLPPLAWLSASAADLGRVVNGRIPGRRDGRIPRFRRGGLTKRLSHSIKWKSVAGDSAVTRERV